MIYLQKKILKPTNTFVHLKIVVEFLSLFTIILFMLILLWTKQLCSMTTFTLFFTSSTFEIPVDGVVSTSETTLSSLNFSAEDVLGILSSLDTSKAMGIDGLGPKLLKFCSLALYEPLFHLFKASLDHHQLPSEWRIHCITPVFKSGDRSCVSNYRPISLLSSTSKVLERLVYNCCMQFLVKSFSLFQFGFIRSRSSLQQLLLFYNGVFETLQTDVIYLDFAKAFDTVAHNELLFKLRNLGICGDNLDVVKIIFTW